MGPTLTFVEVGGKPRWPAIGWTPLVLRNAQKRS